MPVQVLHSLVVRVSADKLGEAISAITPFAAAPVEVRAVAAQPARTREPRSTPPAETRLGRLMLGALERGPRSDVALCAALRDANFSESSLSGISSQLKKLGLVRRAEVGGAPGWELAS